MALEDVYFPIAGNPKIFGISTNDGGDPEGKETKSKTVTINCGVGQELTFYFDTKDGTANNGLQGTFKLNTTEGRIEFFSEKLERAVSEFKIPEEPTVQGESSYETHTILIRLKEGYENISIDSVSVTISFNGTVEILDPGFDEYSLSQCCPCEAFPYIDEKGCERFCTCPPPTPCDNETDCPCNSFCDTTFFENPIYKNGEGECTAGCKTSEDCCNDGENDFRCVDGKCEKATECPCPKGQKCVDDKCEDDPDDPDDPDDGEGCGPDNPCPNGYECVDGRCVEIDKSDLVETDVVYMMSQKIRVSLRKVGFNYQTVINAGDGTLNGIFTDQTIIFRRYRTVDVDEGCSTPQGIYYGEYGLQQGTRYCNIDNIDGAERTNASFKQAFMRTKGTNYRPPDSLIYDEGQFDTPYRSSELKDNLRNGILQMSYETFKGYPKNGILRIGSFNEYGLVSTSSQRSIGQTDASSSYGTDGYIERLRYYFVKKIETGTASSKTYVKDEEMGDPVRISQSTQYDTISISEKDSYVDGRTSNENFVDGESGEASIPWLRTPYDTRIVNRTARSPSGTVYNQKIQEKILITQVYETTLYDVGTSVKIGGDFVSAEFGTPDHLFTLDPDEPEGYCKTYKDCNKGQDCRNNRCVNTISQPCGNNGDCPDGQKCVNKKCVGSLDIDCSDDPNRCPQGTQCVDGKCTTGLGYNTDDSGGGGGDTSNEVHDDSDEIKTEEQNEKEEEEAEEEELDEDECPEALAPIPNAVPVI